MYDILVKPTPRNTYVLQRSFTYNDILVPAGFETNGADVPKLFQNIFPPFQPRFIPAIIMHDYLINIALNVEEKDLRNKTIDMANDLFKEMMLKGKDTFVTRTSIKLVKFYWKIKKPFLKARK